MTQANLNLDNVKLKEDALIKLNLPIKIELGIINHLEVKIPWLNIGSSPVEVVINGLNLIVSPQKQEEWEVIDIFDQSYLEEKLKKALQDIKTKISKEENQGYLEKLATKVVDNLQIRITNVHIRFEDHFTSSNQYNLGICLRELVAQTTNSQWVQKFVDRTQSGQNQNLFKLLSIEGLGFYLNPNDSTIIHQQTDDQEKRTQLMQAILHNDEGLLQYILSPMSLKVKLEYQNKPQKKINISVNLDCINITLLKAQVKCMLKSMELVSEYRSVQNFLLKTRKFKFLRPLKDKVSSENARQWWQYAYNCVKKSNRARNGSLKEFKLQQSKLNEIKPHFLQAFSKFYYKGLSNKSLKPEEYCYFRYALMSLDFNIIKEWVKQFLEPQVKLEKDKSQQSTGITGWLFGATQASPESDEPILTPEELEQLELELQDTPLDLSSKVMHINAQMGIKEVSINVGYITDQNIVEGVNLFSRDMAMKFKSQSYQETSFDMELSISDFGVELYKRDQRDGGFQIEESVVLSNKKIFPQSVDEQMRLKVRCKPEDLRHVEYDINLATNPFVIVYHKEFIRRMQIISQVTVNQNYQSAAIDTLEDFREATSNQVYFLIYKKANRIRINIASPIIILPLSGDSDQKKPVWIFRLGDLHIISGEQQITQSIQEYEKFDILIDSIRMQYYNTFGFWLLMVTEEEKKELDRKPKMLLNCSSSDLKINLTQKLYNKLFNISDIFNSQVSIEESLQQDEEQIQSKLQVLKEAKKIGNISKRLDPAKIWESYYSIISGYYIYFYKDSNQNMPSTYFYLRGAQIEFQREDVSVANNLVLVSRFGECVLQFTTRNLLQEWVFSIRQRINDIRIEDEEYINTLETNSKTQNIETKNPKRKKLKNYETPKLSLKFEMPLFKISLIDEVCYYQNWIYLEFKKMKINMVQKLESSELQLSIKDICLIDLTMMVNSHLIGQNKQPIQNDLLQQISPEDKENNALYLKRHTIQMSHPNYQNIDSQMDLTIENLLIKFQPESINAVLKFLKYTRKDSIQNDKIKEEQISQNTKEIIESDNDGAENVSQGSITENKLNAIEVNKVSCNISKQVISLINVKMRNTCISMLHQNYHMDLFKLESNYLEVCYETKSDHFGFGIKIRDLIIFDMTGYPYTISPKQYLQNPQNIMMTQREIVSIGKREDPSQMIAQTDYGLVFNFVAYEGKACALKRDGFTSKIVIKIKPIKIEYFQESIMRLYSYFFEQFLGSLTQNDPYVDYKAQYDLANQKKSIRRETFKRLPDLQQSREIVDMYIKIEEMEIKIPERPQSTNYLLLSLKSLSVTQSLLQKPKRINGTSEKKMYIQSFKITCEGVEIKFGQKQKITGAPFNIRVLFEKLASSPILNQVDHSLIDQSSHIFVNFDPVDIALNQAVYTGILRCMDLNLNFSDLLQQEYYFIRHQNMEDFFKQMTGVIGMIIKVKFNSLNLKLKHLDESGLAKLDLQRLNINITRYLDSKNEMLIKIQNFFIEEKVKSYQHGETAGGEVQQKDFERIEDIKINSENYVVIPIVMQDQLQILTSPAHKKKNQVVVEMCTNSSGEKDIKVGISGLKITIKPQVLMMIYYFFQNSFPQYEEDSIDKPSYYNFDPEDSAKMDFSIDLQDSLICLQNKPGLKTICIQGKIFFELKKENIKQRKKRMLEQIQKEIDSNGKNMKERLGSQEMEIEQNFENNLDIIERKYVWSMNVFLRDISPFICSPAQLNIIDDFARIKKRQLVTPFRLSYVSNLELDHQRAGIRKTQSYEESIVFGVNQYSELKIERVKMKMSLQDLHLVYQIITFANENVTREYMQKLDKMNDFVNREGLEENMIVMQEKFNRGKTIKQDFGVIMEKTEEVDEELSEDQDKFEEIFENIQQQFDHSLAHQIERLRSTTKAFSNLAHKYTTIAQKQVPESKNAANKGGKFDQKRGKSFFNSRNVTAEIYHTLYSKSNYNEEKDQMESINQAKNVQAFFESNQSVSKKKKQSQQPQSPYYQYQTQSQNLQNIGRTPSKMFVDDSKTRKSAKRSRYISQHNDESESEYLDAKSELFYSAHERNDAEESKFQTPMNANTVDMTKINQDIERETKLMDLNQQIQQKHEYSNCLDTIFITKFGIKSEGFQILFINDYDNAFCPILDLDLPSFQMTTEQVSESSQTKIEIKKLKANYFNALLGDWEPFIENFEMTCLQNMAGIQNLMNVQFPKPININITESCLESLISTYNSWMETPPYQYEDIQMRKRLITESQFNSLNPIQEEEKKGNNDSSNSVSINQDMDSQSVQIGFEENNIRQNSKSFQDNVEKVAPYSIRNITNLKITIVKSEQMTRLEQFEENQFQEGSILQPNRSSFNFYEIDPEKECEYAIDYEKEAADLLMNKQGKKPQRQESISARSRAGTVDQKTSKQKNNQQFINVVFEQFYPITNIDLNKIQASKHTLDEFESEENEQTQTRANDQSTSILNRQSSRSKKSKSRFDQALQEDELIYGVKLEKLRKILIIRTPFIIFNHTKLDYSIQIRDRLSGEIKDKFILNPEASHSLSSDFYQQHDINISISFSKNAKEQSNSQDLERGEIQDSPTSLQIDSLIKLEQGQGLLVDHQNNYFSYISKRQGDLLDSNDFVILPPISLKNALPCEIEVMGVIKGKETRDLDDQIFAFKKGEEKQFHIYSYQGDKKEELNIKIRMKGFNWAQVQIRRRDITHEDKDFTIRDLDGSQLNLSMRVNQNNAGFGLIIFANTIVINHSYNRFRLHYDTLNKQLVAGQDKRKDFLIINKDQPIVACINERYSKTIKVKTVGISEEFSIVSPPSANSRELFLRHKKYEYVYLNYLTLAVDDDYIYTKVIQIQPKYVMINQMKSSICIAQAGNELNSHETLQPGLRVEWVWPDSSLHDEIVVKKVDATVEDMFRDDIEQSSIIQIPEEDRFKKWKWSRPFKINQLGMVTFEVKKIDGRFNNLKSRKIIKVNKKKIDATTYVIFEDEDKKSPYFKIENTTNAFAVWFAQKGYRFDEEACKLVPKSTIPFAFIDPETQNILQCWVIPNDQHPASEGRTFSMRSEPSIEIDFENIDSKSELRLSNPFTGLEQSVYVSIYTDGCTKIVRFGESTLYLEKQQEKIRQNRMISDENKLQMAQSKTFQMNIKEIMISFISTIYQKKKGQIHKSRQEFATLSIQNVSIDQIQNKEFHYHSVRIKSIQIDNQSQMKPLFPTIFQPRVFRGALDQDMIQIQISMRVGNPEITYLDDIDMRFSGFIIKCDDQFLGYAFGFGYGVVELLKKNITGTHPIFIEQQEEGVNSGYFKRISQSEESHKFEAPNINSQQSQEYQRQGVVSIPQKQFRTLKQKTEDIKQQQRINQSEEQDIEEIYKSWVVKTISTHQKRIYINSCKLSQLEIELSFLARKSFQLGEKEDQLQLQNLMNWWGLALINIDEAPIYISPYKDSQKIDMQEDIINQVLEHYQGGFKKNLINLITSTEILGNPRKFFSTVGNGVRDFVNIPLENRDRGALHVIKGGFQGTGSLLKNTFEGGFGFIQSMTGSVSKSLLLMSMDKEYLSIREEQLLTEKPKNIVEGVGFGLATALSSVLSGVTGVVVRPYQEARRDGFRGALLGTYSGLSGMFLKPFSGGLDLISKSTEGMKNTIKVFEAKVFKDRRRLPRPLYGKNQQIKTFNIMDAYIIMRILNTVKDGQFQSTHYIETIKYLEAEKTLFLIICEEQLILLDAKQKSVWWNISPQTITNIVKLHNGLIFRYLKQNSQAQEVMEINNKQQLEKIYEKVKFLELFQ